MFVIKIDNKYLESFIFTDEGIKIKLTYFKNVYALKFNKIEQARTVIKVLNKGETELL